MPVVIQSALDKINTSTGVKQLTQLVANCRYDGYGPTNATMSASIPASTTGETINVSRYGWLDLLATYQYCRTNNVYNTYVTVDTLSNGIVLELRVTETYYSSSQQYYYDISVYKNSNNVRTYINSITYRKTASSQDLTKLYFTISESPSHPGWIGSTMLLEGYDVVYWWTTNIVTRIATPETSPVTELLNGTIPPTYDWSSWTSLSGNAGRYSARLTKIKKSSIGDFSAPITGTANDMDFISSQVDMIPVLQNMSYNHEEVVAWSGNTCWLTMTSYAVQGNPNQAQLMFRFYAEGHSTTTPIFSISFIVGVTGSVPDKNFYLAFVYDDTEQVAVFCPVRHTNSGSYIWGYGVLPSESDMNLIWMWLHMSEAGEDDRPDTPYDQGSTDNGGSDGVIQPPDIVNPGQIPTLDAATKGLFTVYLPTDTQLGDIASFMWSDGVLDNFKKYFGNFNQNIIALYVLPYAPTNPPTKPFKVGRIESDTLTAVGYLNQRFVSIDMGEITIRPRWNSYLDYAPYTKFEIYLPGIGMQALDTDDIMSVTDDEGNVSSTPGSRISLEYHLDLITGICVAYVKVNNDVKYQFPGKLGYTIPLTGEDYGRMITAFATVAAGVAGGIAYGGISAPLKNPAIGHMVGGEVSAAVAGTVNAMKPEVHRSGNLSCEASALSVETPYLIRTMPNKPELVNQQVFTGFPSYKSGVLSDFDGYTECLDAHVEGISCTEEERNMLIEWLRKGVIL